VLAVMNVQADKMWPDSDWAGGYYIVGSPLYFVVGMPSVFYCWDALCILMTLAWPKLVQLLKLYDGRVPLLNILAGL
jgi:hypothetical protein